MRDVISFVRAIVNPTTTDIVNAMLLRGYTEASTYGCIGAARRYVHILVTSTIYNVSRGRIEHSFR